MAKKTTSAKQDTAPTPEDKPAKAAKKTTRAKAVDESTPEKAPAKRAQTKSTKSGKTAVSEKSAKSTKSAKGTKSTKPTKPTKTSTTASARTSAAKSAAAAAAASAGKTLVIVESPAKARTLEKILGRGYHVEASVGHVRDLPKARMAVDIEHDFTPEYINVRGKAALIKSLKAASDASARTLPIYAARSVMEMVPLASRRLKVCEHFMVKS